MLFQRPQEPRGPGCVGEPASRIISTMRHPFRVTQPQEGGESLSCLPSRSRGADLSQTQWPWWLRSHVWETLAKVRSSDRDLRMRSWKLWGNAPELSCPHKHQCRQRSWAVPDEERAHRLGHSRCHGCWPRCAIYHTGAADSKGCVQVKTVNEINGICELFSSLLGAKRSVI